MAREIKELRDKQKTILTAARTKFDEITDETTSERAAEIEGEYDAMMAEHDALGARASRLERLDTATRDAETYAEDVDAGRRPGGEGRGQGADNGETPSYRDAFHAHMRALAQGPLAEPLPQEMRTALQAGYSQLSPEQRAQTTTNAAGGFTVPEEMQPLLIRSLLAWGPMYDEDICTTIATAGGNSLPLPTINDTANQAAASTEGATLTDDGGVDAVFGQKQLDAFSIDTEWLRVSLELATDSMFAFEALMADLLGERLGRKLNAWLTVGTGTSQPNGIVTGSSLGKTVASNAAITADEILDLIGSVNSAYRRSPKSRLMFNDTTRLTLSKLKDGQGNYLLSEASDGSGMLKIGATSARYSINDDMADIGTVAKSMVYGDFSKYFVRKAGGLLIGAIQDKDFWPGFGVAGYARVDGELGDTAAVKHLIHPV